jgi:hypothetical protein
MKHYMRIFGILMFTAGLFLTACESGSSGGDISPLLALFAYGDDGSHAMSAFSFTSAKNSVLSTDVTGVISGTNISVTVPNGTTVTSLVATFTTTGTSVKIGTTEQTSGTTANDFSSAKTYTVTGADGSTQNYTVTVTVASASSKAITAFSFPAVTWDIHLYNLNHQNGNDLGTTISGTSITAKLPYGSTSMVATFATTGASVTVGGVVQQSGVTSNDFKNPVTYRVTAADGTWQDYTVTVLFAPAVNSSYNINQGGVLSSYWKIPWGPFLITYDADSVGLNWQCDAINAGSDNFTISISLGYTCYVNWGDLAYGSLWPYDLAARSSIATVTQDDDNITIVGPLTEIQKLIACIQLVPPQPIPPATVYDYTENEVNVVAILTDKNGLKACGWITFGIAHM